ncbi:TPA: lipopolysaccharide heptosyltransferase II [Candidatus Poribacteria bacterium]|nr:lipopolysaccharide heptosyltransferase II [Candidatus Poribacteria bacterium]
MDEYERILVTQTGGWIGDMILLTPTLRALRYAYENSHITMLVRPLVQKLMIDNPYLDKLMIYDKRREDRGILKLLYLSQRLRELRFDLAVVLHPNSLRSGLIPYLARIPERIGTRINGRGIFLTHSVNDRDDIHEVERYLRVLKLIGINNPEPKLEFWQTIEDRSTVEQFLAECGIANSDILVGVNPGTTWESKRWKLERFAEVIDVLIRKFKARVVLTGSPAEKSLGDRLKELVSREFVNLIGQTDLRQLGALIERMSFYLTCDSGPMHLAAAVNTPTIALFGPTSPIRHAPYGAGHVVIYKPLECSPCYERTCGRRHECMDAIEVREILQHVDDFWVMSL